MDAEERQTRVEEFVRENLAAVQSMADRVRMGSAMSLGDQLATVMRTAERLMPEGMTLTDGRWSEDGRIELDWSLSQEAMDAILGGDEEWVDVDVEVD